MSIASEIIEFLNESKWDKYNREELTITVEGKDNEEVKVDVKIYFEYDSDNKQNNNLWTVIAKDFELDGKKYRKNTEFPSKLEKAVHTGKEQNFQDLMFNLIQ